MFIKFKTRLNKLNGWRRAWFVLTALGLFYGIFIHSSIEASKNDLSTYQYKWAVERELSNPECLLFKNSPFDKLIEPPYTDSEGKTGCYHLYNYRKYHNQITVPYTKDKLDSDVFYEFWSIRGQLALVFGFYAIALSALAYFAGFLIAWVKTGFCCQGKE